MLYKRNKTGNWHTKFTVSGKRIRCSTKTKNKALAEQFEQKLREEEYRLAKLGDKSVYKWDHAVIQYDEEKSHKKSYADDLIHLRKLTEYLRGVPLYEITIDKINEIKKLRKKEYRQQDTQKGAKGDKQQVSNTTVNRMLEVLRAVLRLCKDIGWLEEAPTIKMLPSPKKRVRWITREEAERLIKELPDHLKVMCAFTLATGLRESNVNSLKWEQIDMERRTAWIHIDEIKTEKALAVPLNMKAMEILNELQSDEEYVFLYRGNRVKKCNTQAFKKALERAKIKDFRWHDLRHTWASWHVQSGTPLEVLMGLGGWSDYKMVLRYAHLGEAHYSNHAENICKG